MSIRRILRWTGRGLLIFALLAAMAAAGGLVWLRGSQPQIEGEILVHGPEAPISLLRDGRGLLTVRADSESDAMFGLGFAHAQDRLWQMDFMRRTGAGRLSEVVGSATVKIDRIMRTLGLYRVAEANLAELSPEARGALDAYSAGVNAFLESHGGPWPPEFYLLRYRPEPWRPADSLVWGRLMALQLSGNWSDEIRRLRLSKQLTPEQSAFFWPEYPADGPVALPDLAGGLDRDRLFRLGEVLPWEWAPKTASNTWVVSGRHTASSGPILANDPHLSLSTPGVWYLARIEMPDLTLVGATSPGVPYLVIGHNEHIAWGMTTTEGDTQDLFIERLTAGKPGHYDTPDGPKPFEVRQEVIEVRGDDPVTLEVRETRHGPVASDAFPEAGALAEDKRVIALAWPALRADDRTGEAMYRINRARSWPEARTALRDFHSPQQTMSFADRDGNIALIAPARVPVRKGGDGSLPVPGWSGDYDWTGFIPFEELPQRTNPAAGQLVTANNRLVPESYPHLITGSWRNPFRAARIEDLLAERPKARVQDHAALQSDVFSGGAKLLLPLLLERLELDEDDDIALEAHTLLEGWDHRMGIENPEPLIFFGWIADLNRRLFRDELGEAYDDFARADARRIAAALTDMPSWCDDVTTAPQEDCRDVVSQSYARALLGIRSRFGRNPGEWRWGEAHIARLPHSVMSRIPILNSLVDIGVESGGGSYTVNRGGPLLKGPEKRLFENIHGPGFRGVYDLGALEQSGFMIATGQSGNPYSPFFGNLAKPWRDGELLPLGPAKTQQDSRILVLRSP